MFRLVKCLAYFFFAFLVACDTQAPQILSYGFGTPVSQQVFAKWDIDIGPDGIGLPEGSGTAQLGEPIYLAKCAACHGEFGEGIARLPGFIGTPDELTNGSPVKNVGNYWPYATTLWDYINRAMPFGNAQSLSPDEVYSITAYILSLNNIIPEDKVLDAQTLPQIKMPNREGFITATGADMNVKICMKDCMKEIVVRSRASQSAISLAEKDNE